MRRGAPLRVRGARTNRWAKWRDSQRTLVLLRAQWHCEACDKRAMVEWHHLLGRGGYAVAEPWTSSEALTCGLCWDCHIVGWHQGAMAEEVRSGLLWDAVDRLCAVLGRSRELLTGDDPREVILTLLREAPGVEPPGYVHD